MDRVIYRKLNLITRDLSVTHSSATIQWKSGLRSYQFPSPYESNAFLRYKPNVGDCSAT